MSNVRSALLRVIGDYLDGIGSPRVTVDISVVTDSSAAVYITAPAGLRDEIDEVAIYEALASDDYLSNIDIELEVIDAGEIKDELEGSLTDADSDDDEEEDELAADNLTVLEPGEQREIHLRYLQDTEEEEDEYDDDDIEEDGEYSSYDDGEDVEGVDEYEPTWSDLEEMMRGSDEDY